MRKELVSQDGDYKFVEISDEYFTAYNYAESHFTPVELEKLREGDAWYVFCEEDLMKSNVDMTTGEIDSILNPLIEQACPDYQALHDRFVGYVSEWWHLSILK